MDDTPSRGGGRPTSGREDSTAAVLMEALRRFGESELGCCCALALRASEISGGLPCRVELSPGRSIPDEGECEPDGASPPGTDRGPRRVPIRGPGSTGDPEAWLVVERPQGEGTRLLVDDLRALAACAGLKLERHRLAGDARVARRDAEEIRDHLGHALRGHIHTAHLRTETLLLELRRDGDPDIDALREKIEALRSTVWEMTEGIDELLEPPSGEKERSAGAAPGSRGAVRLPAILREAAEEKGVGDGPPHVEVADDVPPVRADPGRLASALGEIYDLARRSRGTPSLTVAPDGTLPGARIALSVEPHPLPASEVRPEEDTAEERAVTANAERSGGGEVEASRCSLRQLVVEIGGELRIEAGEGTRVKVIVVLPGVEEGDGGDSSRNR